LQVPSQTQERGRLAVLINNGGVVQVPEVKHAHGSICAYGRKDVDALAKRHIVDLLIVGDELGLDLTADAAH
jgi:hypothetical protein